MSTELQEIFKQLLYYYSHYQLLIVPAAFVFITIMPMPVPEDAFIFLFGLLAAQTGNNNGYYIFFTFILVFLSVLFSDICLFYFGRLLKIGTNKIIINNVFFKTKLEKGVKYYNRFGSYAVFIGRCVFGIRSSIFIASGFLEMPLWKFTFFNALAGCLHITLIFFVGYYF